MIKRALTQGIKYTAVVTLLVVMTGWLDSVGYQRGVADATAQAMASQRDEAKATLTEQVDALAHQVTTMQGVSERLIEQLAHRTQDDVQTTQELRDALQQIQGRTGECELDDNILQQLHRAQARAAEAARHGFAADAGRAVPTANPAPKR
ncbi:hypothetical protein ACF1CY_000745 [Providencia rettgeri]